MTNLKTGTFNLIFILRQLNKLKIVNKAHTNLKQSQSFDNNPAPEWIRSVAFFEVTMEKGAKPKVRCASLLSKTGDGGREGGVHTWAKR